MIRHCVFIRFKNDVSDARKAELFSEIEALKAHVEGILAVHAGANVSPETGMDKGYSDGFIVDFVNSASRDAYLVNAQHQEVGAQLVASAVGGAEGILVYDLELPES